MAQPTVCFLTYDWAFGTNPLQPNGCAWYRCMLPMKELEKHEWSTGIGFPAFSTEHGYGLLIPDSKAIHGWDIIVLKLMMLDRFVEEIPKAQAMGQKIVVDIDDHHAGLEKTNMAYRATDPEVNPRNNREHYFKTMELADALITSTPFLRDYYKKKYPNKPIYMVRNGIDPQYFKFRKDKSDNWPVLGWVGATPWRSSDLETLNPFVGEYLDSKKWRFHHAGHITNAPTVKDQLGVPEKLYTSEGMQPILTYGEMFKKIDIGIVPLNNVEFNLAKSFIKGLEYTAAGVPWIATDLEEYSYINKEFGIGRVASTKEEWLNHLDELSNVKTRNKERQKNMELVREYHTMEKRGPEWNKVFREILDL